MNKQGYFWFDGLRGPEVVLVNRPLEAGENAGRQRVEFIGRDHTIFLDELDEECFGPRVTWINHQNPPEVEHLVANQRYDRKVVAVTDSYGEKWAAYVHNADKAWADVADFGRKLRPDTARGIFPELSRHPYRIP